MNHSEIQSLLGAYALDAVDEAEAAVVEAHLAECPRCRDEVAAHRDTAAALASVGAEAPAGLWSRIAANLEAQPAADLERPVPALPVVPRTRWLRALAAAAALVLVVAVAGLGVRLHRLDSEVAALRHPLVQRGLEQAALAGAADPSARRVTLRGNGGGEVDAVVLPDGRGFVVHSDLPALPESMTYQLWGIVDGHTKVSLGLLGARPTVAAFRLDPALVSLLAITEERAAGVDRTDKPAVAWAQLST